MSRNRNNSSTRWCFLVVHLLLVLFASVVADASWYGKNLTNQYPSVHEVFTLRRQKNGGLPKPPDGSDRWNVLMIVIDDLNDWVGHLKGHVQARTPNIDRLASRGLAMERAYAPSAVCLASRTAVLYGQGPNTTGIYGNNIDWYSAVGSRTTSLPQLFKDNGYETIGTGKIFHGIGSGLPGYTRDIWTHYEDPADEDNLGRPFSIPINTPCLHTPQPASGGASYCNHSYCNSMRWGAMCNMKDERRTKWIVERIKEKTKNYNSNGKKQENPFFMSVGYFKPHTQWEVPQKYFDLFPLDEIKLPEAGANDLSGVPEMGKRLANTQVSHATVLKEGLWKPAVRAYLATIAFVDDMVGKVLDELEKSPFANNTITVLWSDHGFHLGTKNHWKKGTLWEETMRVPFIWHVPGLSEQYSNVMITKPIELMSLYKTLMHITGLQPPQHFVEGHSLLKLLKHPKTAKWNRPCVSSYREHFSIVAGSWRYTRYSDGGEELYGHKGDPYEWRNKAARPWPASVHEARLQRLRSFIPENPAPAIPKQNQKTTRGISDPPSAIPSNFYSDIPSSLPTLSNPPFPMPSSSMVSDPPSSLPSK